MTCSVRRALLLAPALGCFVAILVVAVSPSAAQSPAVVPTPTVSLPPNAGAIFNESPMDLAPLGISEEEFFFEGTTSIGPYQSRMIVRRPVDPKRFNGTVIVEWMNASSGNDIDVDFLSLLSLMVEKGYAYVGVTSQQVTVNFLHNWDPPRYSTLNMAETQPGQPAAFEVFSQAGMALLDNGNGVDPLGGLLAERLIAIGQSQSSSRLTTFINTIHDLALEPVYDAIIPHSGGAAPTRFPLPVLKLNSENEAPGYFGQRGVSDALYRYWEVPGSSHQPLDGNKYAHDLLRLVRGSFPECPFPYQGPGGPAAIDPVLRAGVAHVDTWIRTGQAPPVAPLIDMTPNPSNPSQGVIQRDQYGNALGGIRLPQQEVPTGRNTPSFGCAVPFPPFGTIVLGTFPQWDAFDGGADPAVDPTDTVNANEPVSAKAVYGGHNVYVSRFVAATNAVQNAGFILKLDGQKLREDAGQSDIAK